KIVQITGGTFFEITPVKAYPTSYRECVDQAKVEINAGFRPELAAQADLSKFSVIFVGSPNWYGTMAPPVATFLTTNDLKGKTIIPFFTHGGGGMQNCERDIKKLCSGAAVLPAVTYSGASVRRDNTQQLIAEWVASLLTVKK
ncbi:MAG: flavodoxin, partial [Victivallaceae bacterium]|nr:flavodoxin [Victivallaceae bacterium]